MKKPARQKPAPNPEIMVVDDTPANLRLLEIMLRERGYRVRAFPRGRLALAAAAKAPPDLVLLDVNMPEMDGYEVCQRMKADPLLEEIPIIFISALSETTNKLNAFRSGGVDYVTKPFQTEEVLARVANHLGLRETQRRLKESYVRLRKLEALRDNVTQMIVHDLRNPLMVVAGYLDMAIKKTVGSPKKDTARFLVSGRAALSQIQEMVTSILDVSRIESSRMPLRAAPLDLVEVARDSMAQLGPLSNGRTVNFKNPKGGVRIVGDRDLIERVIGNLLGNALKFTPDDGVIRVAVSASSRGGRVEVSDTGPGLDAATRKQIFMKYHQAESHRRRHSTGLGLTFCKLAVEAHGGRIGVDSAPGKGATFWFELPSKARFAATAKVGASV